MQKNIKSTYFIKKFFSYINEKKKLKIVIHNKLLQNYLNIDIMNYKIMSGKYVIIEAMVQEKNIIFLVIN